jgi:hypothetical protein
MIHILKTWPEFFIALESGVKNFELRRNDRPFKVGDQLFLCEYNPTLTQYTGRNRMYEITYTLTHVPGLSPDFIVMALKRA